MNKLKQLWALAQAHPKGAVAVVIIIIALYFLA